MGHFRGTSTSEAVADILREEVLSSGGLQEEWFLGSEDELVKRLGVSRPTLRQAVRLLEQEQLVVVRRGINGGFFGRRPTARMVTHSASVYLRSERVTYGELMSTEIVLSATCAQLAASNPDAQRRRELVDWYDIHAPDGIECLTRAGKVVTVFGFHRLLAALTDNITLRLFVDVLLSLAEPMAVQFMEQPDHLREINENHRAVARAVAIGDGEGAARTMRVHMERALVLADDELRLGPMSLRTRRTDSWEPGA